MRVLEAFNLAQAPVGFAPERLAAGLAEAETWRRVTPAGEVVRAEGSNNWAVAGTRTATGRPILANDPHRSLALPALRYLVHLTAPGLDLIGAGEPVLPGISIGHNGTAAFGLTIFTGLDQEDVLVYETAPDDPELYRFGAGWERMRRVEEAVPVKGCPDQPAVLRFTRHGPVIHEDRAAHRAYALRSVWFEPGSAAYLASLSTMEAQSLAAFRDGLRRWNVPATNQVYADRDGTIAWVPAGLGPLRQGHDGLLPAAGDGRCEWTGFIRLAEEMAIASPEAGFVATANEMNLAPGHVRPDRFGREWIEPSRAERIREVLVADAAHSIAGSCALQTDVASVPARRVTALLRPLAAGRGADDALALLCGWDGRVAADSAAAALFEVWWTRHLRPAVVARLVADRAAAALIEPGDVAALLDVLEAPDARWGAAPEAARDDLLLATLAAAFAECRGRLGADPAQWRWGQIHRVAFTHAAARQLDPAAARVGPFGIGGSDSTPLNASYRPEDFAVTVGAALRLVFDVGAWDNSVCINAPGQSGDPRSAHYADHAGIWAEAGYVPLLYSAEAVDRNVTTTLTLLPG